MAQHPARTHRIRNPSGPMQRRHFLQLSCALMPALAFRGVLAAPATVTPRLLVVFLRGGFLARLATVLAGPRAIALTDSLPVSCRGADIPNISLRSVAKPAFDERQAQILADMYAHHPLASQVREGLDLRQQVSVAMAE